MADITIQKVDFNNGVCSQCGYACPHEVWHDGDCIFCGTICAHNVWENGVCTDCGTICSHSNWESSECTVCGTLCAHSDVLKLTHVSNTGAIAGDTADKLFDNDSDSKWCGNFRNGKPHVIFSVEEAAVLKSYTLTTGNDTAEYPGRNWKDWILYGRNGDEGEWTKIQEVKSANLPDANCTTSQPIVVPKHAPYTHFKLVVTDIEDGNTQQMAELTVTGSCFKDGVCTQCNFDCEPHEYVDGVCETCGTACPHETYVKGFCPVCGMEHDHTGESFVNGVYPCGYACSHTDILSLQHEYGSDKISGWIVDGDPRTYWYNSHPKSYTHYEVFSTVGPTVLKSYTLTVAIKNEDHNWTSWTLYGSHNKNEGWVEIDQVVDTTLVVDSNNVSQMFMVEPHIPYPYYKLVPNDIATNDLTEYHRMAEFTITGYCFNNGTCTTCGYSHSEHSYTNGFCDVCLLKHDHTTENFTDGECAICHYLCPHKAYDANRNCSVCGSACAHAEFENSICKACGYECDHEVGYDAGFCKLCGTEHDHTGEGYTTNYVRTECGYPCSHEAILKPTLVEGSHSDSQNMLDGDRTTMWIQPFQNDGANWLIFTAGEAASIKSYTLTVTGILPGGYRRMCNWKDWTLYGSNSANGDWTEIHRVTDNALYDFGFAYDFTEPFVLSNPVPYTYFKLVVNDCTLVNLTGPQCMADIIITGTYIQNSVCNECGYVCQNHNYSSGICTVCGFGCSHKNYDSGVCIICNFACPHTNIDTNRKCTVCKIDCPHEKGYTDGVCNACGTACDHKSGYNDNGFCNTCAYYEPALLENGVYKISNAGQLYWFAQQVGQGNTGINGELTCDIDLKANSPTSGNWGSLGSEGQPYQGTLDGKGYTVDNVKTWEDRYVGFIRAIGTNGVVRNLGLGQQCSISGYDITGGICGKNEGLIEGCWYRGYLEGRGVANNSTYIGGIAGGIAGENKGTIKNCWFDGLMNESGPDGYYPCDNGGIVGDNTGGLVENCYNVGTLFGWQTYGGIAGSGGTVKNCYARMPLKKASNTSECDDPQGIGYCTVINSYYESPSVHESGETHGIPLSAFSSGELAYKLQTGSKSNELIWGQNLDNGQPRDDHPTLAYHGAPRVYEVKDCQGNTYYSNTDANGGHRYGSNGKCACGAACLHESTDCVDQSNGSHNYICTVCGYVTATETHTFDPETELCECGAKCSHNFENGICTNCGKTNAPIVITRQPTNGEAKLGERYCVDVIAVGEGLQYQWYMKNAGSKSFSKSSVTDNTYDDVMTTARAGREVYCVITDAHGNKVTTDTVKLICVPGEDLAITKQPNDSSAKLGEKYCVTVEAKGDGLKYKWYWRNKGTENWNASGVTDNTYDDLMTSARHNREVKCVISDAWGNQVETEIATITGTPTVTLAITRQPESQTVKLGENFNVTFDAVGDGLKYQWYFRPVGTEKWTTSGQKDNSYDDVMTEARHNRELYCVVTDAWGNQVETNPIVTIMASVKDELAITKQPNHDSAKLGEMFCVTVEAQGDSLKYKWYWRNVGNERWNTSGQRDNTYDDEMTRERNNREVKCVITDMWGNEIESDIAIITGIPTVALEITSQPTDSYVAKGEQYCVTVEAQGDNLTYAWYFKNAGSSVWNKSGVKDNSYDDVMTTARAGREVYCVVTDALGNNITTDHAIIGIK